MSDAGWGWWQSIAAFGGLCILGIALGWAGAEHNTTIVLGIPQELLAAAQKLVR
jgi:hypothetical protein